MGMASFKVGFCCKYNMLSWNGDWFMHRKSTVATRIHYNADVQHLADEEKPVSKDRDLTNGSILASNPSQKQNLENTGSGRGDAKRQDSGHPAFLNGILPPHFSLNADQGKQWSSSDISSPVDSVSNIWVESIPRVSRPRPWSTTLCFLNHQTFLNYAIVTVETMFKDVTVGCKQ